MYIVCYLDHIQVLLRLEHRMKRYCSGSSLKLRSHAPADSTSVVVAVEEDQLLRTMGRVIRRIQIDRDPLDRVGVQSPGNHRRWHTAAGAPDPRSHDGSCPTEPLLPFHPKVPPGGAVTCDVEVRRNRIGGRC